ncbi:MAG: LamG-like jellyroll fold domain-containing protein [Verrucomicrobiota bacterium]
MEIKPKKTIHLCLSLMLFNIFGTIGYSQVVSSDLSFNWEAPTTTTDPWSSTVGSRDWSFNGSPTIGSVSSSTSITHAWNFTSGNGSLFTSPFTGLSSGTFEFWLRPNDLIGQEVVFETGGAGRGLSLSFFTDEVTFAYKTTGVGASDPNLILSHALTALEISEFVQVVGVANDAGTARLYINGQEVDNAVSPGTNWQGTNGAGLGARRDQFGGGSTTPGADWAAQSFGAFQGDFVIMRVYDDALTASEVLQNFNTVAVPEPRAISLLVIALASLFCLSRKKYPNY